MEMSHRIWRKSHDYLYILKTIIKTALSSLVLFDYIPLTSEYNNPASLDSIEKICSNKS